jgi:hypothetical protein
MRRVARSSVPSADIRCDSKQVMTTSGKISASVPARGTVLFRVHV